jgi:acyl-CoA reductase-like NAD-dependent aldehyde dehydrogenase
VQVKLMRDVGFPPGVVNVVLGKGSVIGMALCRSSGIEKIGFTGSTDVGRLVQAAAAEVRSCT